MKKVFIALLLLFTCINTRALTLKPTGATKGGRGSDVTVYVTLTREDSDKKISGLDGVLSYDSKVLTLKSQSNLLASNNWTELSPVSNNGKFGYANLTFNNLIGDKNKNVVKLVFNISSSASFGNTNITISNPSATDDSGDGVTISGGTLSLNVLSNVNTLSSLKIDNVSVDNFSSETTSYSKTVDASSITISANATDTKATITGLGTKNLNYGLNTFKIVVTSEAGNKKEYILNITRRDTRSKVNTLKSLKLSSGTINFKSDTTTYNVNVEKSVSSITITSELTDSKAKYVTGYGNRKVTLKEGLNTVLIKVTAENGDIRTYTLNITRESSKNNNESNVNTLKSLKLSSGTINFKSDITTYDVSVEQSVSSITITSELTDSKAKYVTGYGNRKVTLKDGLNTILIKVMAENESVKTYTLNIIRGEIQMDPNDKSNAYIQGITIDNYNINFSKDVFEYNLQINNEASLNIVVQMENGNASYEILNNENLKDGSQIIINTTSSDGENKLEYKINISSKQNVVDDNKNNNVKDDSNNMMGYYIGIGTCLIGLIALISAIVYCKKKA